MKGNRALRRLSPNLGSFGAEENDVMHQSRRMTLLTPQIEVAVKTELASRGRRARRDLTASEGLFTIGRGFSTGRNFRSSCRGAVRCLKVVSCTVTTLGWLQLQRSLAGAQVPTARRGELTPRPSPRGRAPGLRWFCSLVHFYDHTSLLCTAIVREPLCQDRGQSQSAAILLTGADPLDGGFFLTPSPRLCGLSSSPLVSLAAYRSFQAAPSATRLQPAVPLPSHEARACRDPFDASTRFLFPWFKPAPLLCYSSPTIARASS